MALIWTLIVGVVAGFLAGQIFRGSGFGIVGNVAVGVVGALIGGFLFGNVFVVGGLIGRIICATIGAIILLFVISLVNRKA
ncbi:GlsB/YeaQ/YmgE family stress response membrane protein [Xanthobacter sp. TB0136]|uniref:GlsB/YeaQ/YmgE family stress response membrane protein n=1 Tax=Xanthobacter sp. TB0136 TaxID=3459177 RepID=UPI00403978D2